MSNVEEPVDAHVAAQSTCDNRRCQHEQGAHTSFSPHFCTSAGCDCRAFRQAPATRRELIGELDWITNDMVQEACCAWFRSSRLSTDEEEHAMRRAIAAALRVAPPRDSAAGDVFSILAAAGVTLSLDDYLRAQTVMRKRDPNAE
jgi:hypothetical protein